MASSPDSTNWSANPIALVGDQIASWMSDLQTALPNEQLMDIGHMNSDQRAAARIAIVTNPRATELECLPNLRWIHSLWAGVDQLTAVAQQRGIGLTRLVDPQLADTMAEATLAWCLYLSRMMPEYKEQQRQTLWRELPYRPTAQWHVSILGMGELGLASAIRLRDNGYRVSAWSRSPKQCEGVRCVNGMQALDRLLQRSDITVCLLPLTSATRGLLNATRFAQLKPSASLINFARGPIVVTADLIKALQTAQLRHAVLDVFDEEPLPNDSELWRLDNATLLPHSSAPTPRASAIEIVARNISSFRATQNVPNQVDLALGY